MTPLSIILLLAGLFVGTFALLNGLSRLLERVARHDR